MKYRWRSTVEIYDDENVCGFGNYATIEVEVTTNAKMAPAEPDVGIMNDEWDFDYEFSPNLIIPTDEDGCNKESIEYQSLSEEVKEKVMKFCKDNKEDIEEKASDKGPSNYDLNYYKIS